MERCVDDYTSRVEKVIVFMEDYGYQIIPYRPMYKNEIINLQTFLWGADLDRNKAYFEWKYESNPFHPSPIIYLALFQNKVVAMRGFIGSKWYTNSNEIINCLLLADSVTHPDHRRKGLFTEVSNAALGSFIDGEYYYVLNLSSGRMSTSSNLKLGWRSLGANIVGTYLPEPKLEEPNLLTRIFRNLPVAHQAYRKLREGLDNISQARINEPTDSNPNSIFCSLDTYFESENHKSISISKKPRIIPLTEFIANNSSGGCFRQVRDTSFFGWRYNNPKANYRFLYIGDNKLEGYMVLRESVYPKRDEVNIVDWEVSGLNVMKQLLKTILDRGNFIAVTVWATTFSKEEIKLFQETGFILAEEKGGKNNSEARPSVLIKPIRENYGPMSDIQNYDIYNIENWDLRPIYSDGN